MIDFGKRLKLLRKEKNLTQAQLASLIGVQSSIISFYEVGERLPSLDSIIKFASVFHVSTDYLLGVDRTNTVDVSGLSEEEVSVIRSMVEVLRNKNNYL